MTTTVDIDTIRNHFLGWQCRLRQHAIRNLNGMPTKGLRPDVIVGETDTAYDGVTVLIVHKDSEAITKEFRHMVKRTKDPKQRYDSALKFMAESFYQHPLNFSDGMTALFGPGSSAAENLLSEGRATLLFEEKNQKYTIPCSIELLSPDAADWQATFWHNHLFSPSLPGDSQVLQFLPDWEHTEADPSVY